MKKETNERLIEVHTHFWRGKNTNILYLQIYKLRFCRSILCGAGGSVTQRARVRSPVGTSFLGEVFSGFFLTCKTNVRKSYTHQVPECHLVILIILFIYTLLEWMSEWCVSSIMFVLSRRWPRHWADHSSGKLSMSCSQSMWFTTNSLSRQVMAL